MNPAADLLWTEIGALPARQQFPPGKEMAADDGWGDYRSNQLLVGDGDNQELRLMRGLARGIAVDILRHPVVDTMHSGSVSHLTSDWPVNDIDILAMGEGGGRHIADSASRTVAAVRDTFYDETQGYHVVNTDVGRHSKTFTLSHVPATVARQVGGLVGRVGSRTGRASVSLRALFPSLDGSVDVDIVPCDPVGGQRVEGPYSVSLRIQFMLLSGHFLTIPCRRHRR